ncbi:hypothetical protein POM88_026679 [Heracleum sosnowskyi]|uniref:Uncharacterized protein n=1 Tax=Heracleum sosnowskyi TaxID=360622 RepID=A0AAD8MKV6_9APIA|nr:hypothetical protein POM88_026679 [Heracleum sosnowskyi]
MPALHALLGIWQSDAVIVQVALLKLNCVSVVRPLLNFFDFEERETTVYLLFLFSQQRSQRAIELLEPFVHISEMRLLEINVLKVHTIFWRFLLSYKVHEFVKFIVLTKSHTCIS